ncbi:NO-inducible flavohemoprotein [Dasania sp. GY-MA-18]|uniref:nitric oxide dioxygenase n=1 Tax=Dasania phycosphaerae TaxID=2950436 RepID=A0A9J6RP04_9GAMM|nr:MULTISPECIES: NO-inducible flavohemoprotein [Dasania]MCR8923430.1 NO-inducible flavohemoprotein [Dasania sp. GY-MA-18]MCZ0865863.1 NO-inducible flavohemoprotein [Dasania phycosphaerae]MCZ0869587.1 NO-inducible flavohemoprotein [Dasania phycosphaerae]
MLSQQSKDLVNASLPAVGPKVDEITAVFYPIMFSRYPQVKAYFNQAHQAEGSQPRALANAVVAYATNLDRLELLGDAVALIVQKHVSLNILPEHYPIVGECLLAAIKEVLGDVASDEILAAWGEAYQQLADLLIAAEEQAYQQNEQQQGGWRGEREFILRRKEQESEVISSFYFEPADGKAIAKHLAGQYTTIVFSVNGETLRRNYSLSNQPGTDYYRISVKREPGGVASNYLHDHLSVGDRVALTPPAGNFTLNQENRPVVLLTGGVGITPAMSMLNPALASGREVHFVHAAINGRHHAFKEHVDQLAVQHSNLKINYCYEKPSAEDKPHAQGYLNRELLADMLPSDKNIDVYMLGPKPFMRASYSALKALGVPVENIQYEFFGPLESLEPAA